MVAAYRWRVVGLVVATIGLLLTVAGCAKPAKEEVFLKKLATAFNAEDANAIKAMTGDRAWRDLSSEMGECRMEMAVLDITREGDTSVVKTQLKTIVEDEVKQEGTYLFHLKKSGESFVLQEIKSPRDQERAVED